MGETRGQEKGVLRGPVSGVVLTNLSGEYGRTQDKNFICPRLSIGAQQERHSLARSISLTVQSSDYHEHIRQRNLRHSTHALS